MGFNLGFRVWSSGFRFSGLGFGVLGFNIGFRVWSSGFRFSGLGFGVLGLGSFRSRVQIEDFGIRRLSNAQEIQVMCRLSGFGVLAFRAFEGLEGIRCRM